MSPPRRLVLTAGTLAVVAGAVSVLQPFDRPSSDVLGGRGSTAGSVLVPVSYQFDMDPPGAGPHLRALAVKIKDAEYDHLDGRYMYHHTRVWGDPLMTSPDGRHHVAFASEAKVWQAADGTGSQMKTQLEPQYPDQESRDYWQRKLDWSPAVDGTAAPAMIPLPPVKVTPPSVDPSRLRELLKVESGPGAASKKVSILYAQFVVPRADRAEILRVLADVPGVRWRGADQRVPGDS